VLVDYPRDYEKTATGSLHSLGDGASGARDEREPPVTAYFFGHHTEFSRGFVVPHEDGRRALAEFVERPHKPPAAIRWEAE